MENQKCIVFYQGMWLSGVVDSVHYHECPDGDTDLYYQVAIDESECKRLNLYPMDDGYRIRSTGDITKIRFIGQEEPMPVRRPKKKWGIYLCHTQLQPDEQLIAKTEDLFDEIDYDSSAEQVVKRIANHFALDHPQFSEYAKEQMRTEPRIHRWIEMDKHTAYHAFVRIFRIRNSEDVYYIYMKEIRK